MAAEIAYYRTVPMLKSMNKRVLTRIWEKMKIKKFHRNQVLITEGEKPKYVFIIKSGEFKIKKHVYKEKLSDLQFEQGLLKYGDSTALKRFSSNFVPKLGMKKDFELTIKSVSNGNMLSDYEIIFDLPS